jgi:hypothetical protein
VPQTSMPSVIHRHLDLCVLGDLLVCGRLCCGARADVTAAALARVAFEALLMSTPPEASQLEADAAIAGGGVAKGPKAKAKPKPKARAKAKPKAKAKVKSKGKAKGKEEQTGGDDLEAGRLKAVGASRDAPTKWEALCRIVAGGRVAQRAHQTHQREREA